MAVIYVYDQREYSSSLGGLDYYLLAYSTVYGQLGGAFWADAPSLNTDTLLDLSETEQTVTIGGNFSKAPIPGDYYPYNFMLSVNDNNTSYVSRKYLNMGQTKSALTFREGGTVNFIAFTGDKNISADNGNALSDQKIKFFVENIYLPPAGVNIKNYGVSVVSLDSYGISASSTIQRSSETSDVVFDKDLTFETDFSSQFTVSARATLEGMVEPSDKGDKEISNTINNTIQGAAARARNITIKGNLNSEDISVNALMKTNTAVLSTEGKEKHYVAGVPEENQLPIYYKDGELNFVPRYYTGDGITFDWNDGAPIISKGGQELYVGTDGFYYYKDTGEKTEYNAFAVTPDYYDLYGSTWEKRGDSDYVASYTKYVGGISEEPIYYCASGDLYFVPKYYTFRKEKDKYTDGDIIFNWNNGNPNISYYDAGLHELYIGTDGYYHLKEDDSSIGIKAMSTTPNHYDMWDGSWKVFGKSTGTKEIRANQIRATGLWAENKLQVDGQLSGIITAVSSENMISDLGDNYKIGAATADSPAKLTDTENNKISSYGLYSATGEISLGGAADTAIITVEANGNTFYCEPDPGGKGFDKANFSTMTGNKIESIGIKANALTVNGIFAGNIISNAIGNFFHLNDTTPDSDKKSLMNNAEEASGVHVTGNLTTTDTFGGTITVDHSASSWDNTSASTTFDYRTAGIFVDGNLTINSGKGSFDTAITVTSDLKFTTDSDLRDTCPDSVYGVKTNVFKAEAFTGSITVDGTSTINAAILYKHDNYGLYATEYANAFDNTFDILGTITMKSAEYWMSYKNSKRNYAIYGDYSEANPNLRLAGTITVTNPELDYAFQRGTVNNRVGSVTLAASANIQGRINSLFGRNVVYIDSNARLNGDVTTDYGTRSVEFVLNRFGGLEKAADTIPEIDATDDVLDATDAIIHSYGGTLSTSGLDMAINLNAANNGTYVLFDNLTLQQINQGWKGLSLTFKYDKQENLKSVVDQNGEIITNFGNIQLEAFSREIGATGKYQICLEVSGMDLDAPLSNDKILATDNNETTIVHDLAEQAKYNQDAHTYELTWGLSTYDEFDKDSDKANIRFELEYWKSDVCDPGQSIVINIDATDSRYYNKNEKQWHIILENVYDDTTLNYRIRAVRGDKDLPNSISSIGAWTDKYTKDTGAGEYTVGTIISTNVKDPSGEVGITNAITELQWNDVAADCEAGFKNYTVEFFFASEHYDDTETSQTEYNTTLSEIWNKYDAGTLDPEEIKVYQKTTTTNKVLLSRLDETQYLYWRVKTNDLRGNSSNWKQGQTFILNRNDSTPPKFPDPTSISALIGKEIKDLSDIFSVETDKWFLNEYAYTEDTTAEDGKVYYTKSESNTYTKLIEGVDYTIGDPIQANTWYEHVADRALTVKWYNIAEDNTRTLDPEGKVLDSKIYQYVFSYCERDENGNPIGETKFVYVPGRESAYAEEISLVLTGDEMPDPTKDYNWTLSAMDFANLTTPLDQTPKGIIYGDKTAPVITPGDATVVYNTLDLPEAYDPGKIFKGSEVSIVTVKNNLNSYIDNTNNDRIHVTFSVSATDEQREGLDPKIKYNKSGVDLTSYVIHFKDSGQQETLVNLASTDGDYDTATRHIEYEWAVGGESVAITMDAPNLVQEWYFTLSDMVGNMATSDPVSSSGVDTAAPVLDGIKAKSEMIDGTNPGKVGIRVNWNNAVDPDQTAVKASGLYYYELQLYYKDEDEQYKPSGEAYHILVMADKDKTDAYTYDFDNLDYGAYRWSIQAFDRAGNYSVQQAYDVVMDSLVFDSTYLHEPVIDEQNFTVTLSWDPAQSIASDIESYTVSYRIKNTQIPWTEVQLTGATTTYTITSENLQQGKTYEWKVDAKNTSEQIRTAECTEDLEFTMPAAPPELELTLTANPVYANNGNFTVTLNWSMTGEKSSNYTLWYTDEKDPSLEDFEELEKGITVTTAEKHEFGSYMVSAKDGNYGGEIRYSNVITVLADVTGPKYGEGAATYTELENGYNFTWATAEDLEGKENEVISGMKQYVVEFSTDQSYTTPIVIEPGMATSTFLTRDAMKTKGLADGKYYWRVCAEDKAGNTTYLNSSTPLDIDLIGPVSTDKTTMKTSITVNYNQIKPGSSGTYDDPLVRDPYYVGITLDVSDNSYTDRNGRTKGSTYDCFCYEIATDASFRNIIYSTDNDYFDDKNTKSFYAHNTLTLDTYNNGITRLAGYKKGQVFYWRVRAVDTVGNYADNYEIGSSFTLSDPNIKYDDDTYAPIQDLYTKPTAPTNLSITPYKGTDQELIDNNAYTFSWTPAFDAFGIKQYEVVCTNKSTKEQYTFYLDASKIQDSTYRKTESFDYAPKGGFTAGDYQFKVRAYDGSGKVGDWSNSEIVSIYSEPTEGSGRTSDTAISLANQAQDYTKSYTVDYKLPSKTLGPGVNCNELWFRVGGAAEGADRILTSGMLNFTIKNSNSKLNVTLYNRSQGKIKSFTVNGTGGLKNFIYNYEQFSDLIYIQVQNLNKKVYDVMFNMTVDLDYFPSSAEDLGPNSFQEAEKSGVHYLGATGKTTISEWVGIGDPADYWMLVGGEEEGAKNSGQLNGITISGVQAKLKVSLYAKEAAGSYKKLATKTISKDATLFAKQMVDKSYFVVVESGDNGAGKQNSNYKLTVSETYYQNNNDSWENPTAIVVGEKKSNQWVGYGDPQNHYQFTVTEEAGDGVFSVDLRTYTAKVNAALYNVSNGSYTLISKQVSVKGDKTNIFVKSAPVLEAGKTYMVVVDAGNVKKASQNTYFDIKVSETQSFKQKQANNAYNSFDTAFDLNSSSSHNGWVGFNDAENFYKFTYTENSQGKRRPIVKAAKGSKITSVFYDSMHNVVKEKQMVSGNTYYLQVYTKDAKKNYSNDFTVTMQYK